MIRTVTIHPARIGCPSIPGTMKGIVSSIPGVEAVRVRYKERSLDITLDDTRTTIKKIIQKIGEEMGLAMEVSAANEPKTEGDTATACPM